MDVDGVTQCNAEWSQMIPKCLVFALQKKEGRTVVSITACCTFDHKNAFPVVGTCLDKWFT